MEWFGKLRDVVSSFSRQPNRPMAGLRNLGTQRLLPKIVFIEVNVTTTNNTTTNSTTDNSTTYGSRIQGDIIGSHIADSLNVVNRLQGASAGSKERELGTKLKNLHDLVSQLVTKLPADDAETASRDMKRFAEEVTSKKPRADQCQVSGKGLIEAAKTVAEMVGPITTAVRGIIALLIPGAA